MVDKEKENLLPGDHEDNSHQHQEKLDADDKSYLKDENKMEFLNQFHFKNDQKIYWGKEQEVAVEDYLRMSEVWLKNKVKWELEDAKDNKREPDWDLILSIEDLIEESKDPDIKRQREKIFRDKINGPLNKLVENIVFSYKLFRGDVDVKSLQWDCLGFLMEKFANFKPSKGKRSFSYYGTVVKHYLIGEKKDNYKSQTNNLEYESFREEVNNKNKYELGDVDPLEESSRLFNHIVEEIQRELSNTIMSENDRNVGNAIVTIFQRHEETNIYKKNNLYKLIKEFTGLETKDITYSLNRFKTLYKLRKEAFIKDSE
jgi:hypothetical protein